MKRVTVAITALMVFAGCHGATPAPSDDVPVLAPDQVVSLEVRAPREDIAPGANGDVVVALRIARGYHVMSDRPSAPEYIATRLHLEDADGLAWGSPRYPPGVAFTLGGVAIATFRGDVEVHVPVDVTAAAAPGARVVAGALRYQACTDTSCLFPITRRFAITIHVGHPTAR